MKENRDDVQKINLAQLKKFDKEVLAVGEAINEVEKKESDIQDKTKEFEKKLSMLKRIWN